MNGIDISNWQNGINLNNIQADFVIMKATEGTYYNDAGMENFYSKAKASNKLRGLYHFASGTAGATSEANFFIKKVKPYINDCILCLDWEAGALSKGPSYAKEFMDTVYQLTGQRCFIYMSKSTCTSYNWSNVAPLYPLWVAQYASNNHIYSYQENPWSNNNNYGAWTSPAIFQYTDKGHLTGWNGCLDFDKCFLTKEEWLKYQNQDPQTSDPVLEQIAKQVIQGKWGNGEDRKNRLINAGYDYYEIQKIVNNILNKPQTDLTEIAKQVIQGKWGNSEERKQKLTNAGYNYEEVQKIVNNLLRN